MRSRDVWKYLVAGVLSVASVILLTLEVPNFGTETAAANTPVVPVAMNLPESVPAPTKEELFTRTNVTRAAHKRPQLTQSLQLQNAAQNKCHDMVKKDYWAHKSPTGEKPSDFVLAAGFDFQTTAENLLTQPVSIYGSDAQEKIDSWMLSSGHRTALLNPEYQEVGFGICYSENYTGKGQHLIIVQEFGTKF